MTDKNPLLFAGRRPRPGTAPADERGQAAHLIVDLAIRRVEEVIDEETAALRQRRTVDMREFNNRKSQGLLELTRALRLISAPGMAPQAIRDRLAVLRGKLEINQSVLKMHLDAVREISGIISSALRDADSDGTYSLAIRAGARR